ncbi:hypothetical protein [Fibrella arboris]|uniref:hypothetical protein n=1 Tax=Fibrella arboris TaxID=3242486 RepID=UPI0035208D86
MLYTLLQLERKFWTLIADTELTLDPAMKSIKVTRTGTSTLLTINNVALIESHSTAQGKFTYHHFRFVDHDGYSTFFFDYGKGLGFAIETYFKGVPIQWVEHKFPFDSVQVV